MGGSTSFVSGDPAITGQSVAPTPENEGDGNEGDGGEFAASPEGDDYPGSVAWEGDSLARVAGDLLYRLDWRGALTISDFEDPDAPREIARLDGLGDAAGIEVLGSGTRVVAIAHAREPDRPGSAFARVVAIDAVSLDLREAGEVRLPGWLQRHWLQDDVVYLFLYRMNQDRTDGESVLASVRVLGTGAPELVAELTFPDRRDGESWRKATIQRGERRFYVATPPPWGATPYTSEVEVIDATDTGGKLVRRATFEVPGEIHSRAQLDEHAGVLRVVTANPPPPDSSQSRVATLRTYEVPSPGEAVSLAEAEVTLPDGGYQDVTFGGANAYVGTAVRVGDGPNGWKRLLQTIDVSDPAAPRSGGVIELFGERRWLALTEAADRLVALGFDTQSESWGVEIALHDVSDPPISVRLDHARLIDGDLSRAVFDNGFGFFEAAGLALVPYSVDRRRCGNEEAEVQVVGVGERALTAGGRVDVAGQYLSGALPLGDRLLLLHDAGVDVLDATDVANPRITGVLPGYRMAPFALAGDRLARVGTAGSKTVIDVVAVERADVPADRPSVLEPTPYPPGHACLRGASDYFATEERIYVVQSEDLFGAPNDTIRHVAVAYAIDETETPRMLGALTAWDSTEGAGGPQSGEVIEGGDSIALVGTTLAFQFACDNRCPDGPGAWVRLVDFTDAANPRLAEIDLPRGGATELRAGTSSIAASHHEPAGDDKVRFYLDRIDLSDPAKPELLDPVNIPGWLVAYDDRAAAIATLEPVRVVREAATVDACRGALGPGAYFDDAAGACLRIDYIVHSASLDGGVARIDGSFSLPEGSHPVLAAAEGTVMALTLVRAEDVGSGDVNSFPVLVGSGLGSPQVRFEIVDVLDIEPRSIRVIEGLVLLSGEGRELVLDPGDSRLEARTCEVPFPGGIEIALRLDRTICDGP